MSGTLGMSRKVMIGISLALGACGSGGIGRDFSMMGGSDVGAATIDRSMLSAMPCINDAIRMTFSTLPSSEASYFKVEHTSQPHIKQKLIVYLDPSDSAAPRPDSRRIVYEIFHAKTNAVGIRYRADVPKALQQEWMAQAFLPLEQCGAIRR
jgi:hypothetical protein